MNLQMISKLPAYPAIVAQANLEVEVASQEVPVMHVKECLEFADSTIPATAEQGNLVIVEKEDPVLPVIVWIIYPEIVSTEFHAIASTKDPAIV